MAFHDPQFASEAMALWRQETARTEQVSRGFAWRRLQRRMGGIDPLEWTGDDPDLIAAQEAYRAAHTRWITRMDDR